MTRCVLELSNLESLENHEILIKLTDTLGIILLKVSFAARHVSQHENPINFSINITSIFPTPRKSCA